MFYPNHHTRTYCIYLGSISYQEHDYDLGVYIHPDKSVSHDIVFGHEDHEYMSGEFIFQGKYINAFNGTFLNKVNKLLYEEYLIKSKAFPQPDNFKQR